MCRAQNSLKYCHLTRHQPCHVVVQTVALHGTMSNTSAWKFVMASQGTVQIFTCTNIHVHVMRIHSPCTMWITRVSHRICSMCLLHRTVHAGSRRCSLREKKHCSLSYAPRDEQRSLKKFTTVVLRLPLPQSILWTSAHSRCLPWCYVHAHMGKK